MRDLIRIFGTGSGECVAATIDEPEFDISSLSYGLHGRLREFFAVESDSSLSWLLEVTRQLEGDNAHNGIISCPWQTTREMLMIGMTGGMNIYRRCRQPSRRDFRHPKDVLCDWIAEGYPHNKIIDYVLPEDQTAAKIFALVSSNIQLEQATQKPVIAFDKIHIDVWKRCIEESIQDGWNAEHHREIRSS